MTPISAGELFDGGDDAGQNAEEYGQDRRVHGKLDGDPEPALNISSAMGRLLRIESPKSPAASR